MRATKAIINSEALLHNLQLIKKLAPHSDILAVVKANAYGHGLERVSNILMPHVDAFGVACTEEAIILRESGISSRIILLEGIFESQELSVIERFNLELVVHSPYQLDAILNYQTSKKIKIWLKLDTGMHRLGFNSEQFIRANEKLEDCPHVESPIGLMSHFSDADNPQLDITEQQINLFNKLTKQLKGPKTLANSAAILAWPESHHQLVRPGLLLFGCSPLIDMTGRAHGLKSVMTLESKLISIKDIKKGESVGYGSSWTAHQDTKIGVIAIGYGDGYPRHAKTGTPIWLNDRLVPLSGRVSMDMITVDLGKNSQDKVGDRAVLWGDELAIEEIAKAADTISYELLCGISRRVEFNYTKG